jgi:rod shape determining protein RodA
MLDDSRKYRRTLKQTVDWKLIFCYLALVLFGWLNIYASIHSSDPSSIFDLASRSGKQFLWILTSLGLGGMILFVFNARLWEVISIPSYAIVFFLLVLVIFVSDDTKGSHSWFEFGPIKFQPAEISKITTSLVLAMVMSKPGFKISKIKHFLTVAAVIALPMLAIIGESETGSALVYAGFIFVLYREGFSGWFLLFIGLVITLFIVTLTASPYASLIVLACIVSICYSLYRGNLRDWFSKDFPFLLFMSLLPWLWTLLCRALVPEAFPELADAAVRAQLYAAAEASNPAVLKDASGQALLPLPNVLESTEPSSWAFLLKIKPIYILLACFAVFVPVNLVRSYKERISGLGISLVAMLIGIALTFSTSFIFDNVLQPHQQKRIEVLLGITEDLSGVGYNVNQSKIAIGSGGFLGKGFLQGTQTTYGFVPEQSTDFIFCTVGEEWGFVGCAVVILLYVFLIWRIIDDAEKSREAFTRIYGYCVASCIFMHLLINIGMTIGLMPVIGIPLPLLSYGGSSLWAFTILIFIFIALNREEKKYF